MMFGNPGFERQIFKGQFGIQEYFCFFYIADQRYGIVFQLAMGEPRLLIAFLIFSQITWKIFYQQGRFDKVIRFAGKGKPGYEYPRCP